VGGWNTKIQGDSAEEREKIIPLEIKIVSGEWNGEDRGSGATGEIWGRDRARVGEQSQGGRIEPGWGNRARVGE
jgi:hypothetical protein